jgi:hypothetical protein
LPALCLAPEILLRGASREYAVGHCRCAIRVGAAFGVLLRHTRAQKGRFGKNRLDCCAGIRIQVIEKRHEIITTGGKHMKTVLITNDEEHRQALQEIERLWNAVPGSKDEVRLEELVNAVEAYESAKFSDQPKDESR